MNTTVTYAVAGMTCNGCVNKVTGAVEAVKGVQDVDVDVATGMLEVVGSARPADIRAAVKDVGYSIVEK